MNMAASVSSVMAAGKAKAAGQVTKFRGGFANGVRAGFQAAAALAKKK